MLIILIIGYKYKIMNSRNNCTQLEIQLKYYCCNLECYISKTLNCLGLISSYSRLGFVEILDNDVSTYIRSFCFCYFQYFMYLVLF